MKIYEAKRVINNEVIGKEYVNKGHHNDPDHFVYVVEDDGIGTGKERLLNLLDEVALTYAPIIEMTANEKEIFDSYRYPEYDDYDEPFSNFMHQVDTVGGYRDRHSLFLTLSEEDLMHVWLNPDTIVVKEVE